MPMTAPASKRQFPLHVHISVMFTLLLIVLGVALGIFNYLQTTRIILNSSQQLFHQIEQDVQQDLQHTYQPIRHALRLLSLNANTGIERAEDRMALLEPFVQTLKDNPALAALYVGDAQGNFFLVRPLRTQAAKDRLSAPQSAAYEAWSIQRSDQIKPLSRHFFYDESLSLAGQRDNPNETYDPRQRSWFIPARGINNEITTSPYLFFSTREVGTTLSGRGSSKVVMGADLTLSQLSATLARHKVTPHTEIALFDQDNNAIAYPDYSKLVAAPESSQLPKVEQLSPALGALITRSAENTAELTADQRQWIVSRAGLSDGALNGLHLALMVPKDELLADAYRMRWQGALVTLGIVLLCLPVGWLISRLLVKPLRRLVQEAEAIRRFDFDYPASPHSPVLEIDQLASSMRRMKETLASFFEITASLSAHTRFEPLLQSVVLETMKIAQAQAGLIYLTDNEGPEFALKGLIIGDQAQDLGIVQRSPIHADARDYPQWLRTLRQGSDSVVCTLNLEQSGDLRPVLQALDTHSAHLLGIRLHNRHGETVGILVLLLNNSGSNEDREHLRADRIAFIQAVSGAAAVSIESQRLQERQKQLLDAFIQLLAGAIDAKSPYTGSHCQRVPALTLMLAEAASASQAPEFENYSPTDEEWEALHIASWLHDCGKVTTPEYVVDKATKLETLYDRIHEIRTRFEVLKRDAWVSYWQGRALGGNDQQLTQILEAALAALDDDFAFVAHCNMGGEAMAEADLQRLQTIALRTWTRTLDDRLGVSWEENKRQATREEHPLPVTERLLADKPEHLFERNESERIEPDNIWGFQLDVPPYKFNRGELYNLSTTRGTLTREERYIINNHIVQTILMLKHLPFPSYLGNIAEIAGGHHEKMDGTGYPKRLKREEMSLAARMMAIADIFEALTASDRPYKKGKTLSEALSIMAAMCHDAHIDPQLFALFMHEQIFMQYARRFLEPGQIDDVDIDALLRKAGLAA